MNSTGVKAGSNLTDSASDGVYFGVGVNANSPTSHQPTDSFRGALDQLQVWTHALDAAAVRADYRTLGRSPSLQQPALRFTFDEGDGEVAANTGAFHGGHLRLGRTPDGSRFYDTMANSYQYTSPAWAPSQLPLNASAVGSDAPITGTFRPGAASNITLVASTPLVRIRSLPSHGTLLLGGVALAVGTEVPSGSEVAFVTASSEHVRASFSFTGAAAAPSNQSVILLPESPPFVVLSPPPCSWPRCARPECRGATGAKAINLNHGGLGWRDICRSRAHPLLSLSDLLKRPALLAAASCTAAHRSCRWLFVRTPQLSFSSSAARCMARIRPP